MNPPVASKMKTALSATIWAIRRWPGLAIIPAIFFVAAVFGESVTSGPILCIFRRLTGIPCAGCGMTRAFVALAHFDLHAAVFFNPLSPIGFTWMGLWWVIGITSLLRGREIPPHPSWLLKTGLTVLSGWWILRTVLFLSVPGAWETMVDTSFLMALADALWN